MIQSEVIDGLIL